MTMLSSRRAILYHANSFLRSNIPRSHNNFAAALSSISHKNLGPKTPEELSRVYKTAEGSQVTSGERSSGATNTSTKGAEKDPNAYEQPEETVARTAKVAAAGAVETGLRLGKMAKQTVDDIWDAAEETAENVRDSVADDIHNGGGRRARTSDIEDESSDKFVKELRRRAAGYDLKDE